MIKSRFIFIFLFFLLFLLGSCVTNKFNSFNFIGGDYQSIIDIFRYKYTGELIDNIHLVEKKDSLIIASTMNNQPWSGIFLFQDGKCFYQKMNIYCSDCADKLVNDIINDKKFKFKAINTVNYISQKKDDVVLRLKDKLDENGNCSEITIYKIIQN